MNPFIELLACTGVALVACTASCVIGHLIIALYRRASRD